MKVHPRDESKPYLEAISKMSRRLSRKERWICARLLQGNRKYGIDYQTGKVTDEMMYEAGWEYWERRWEEKVNARKNTGVIDNKTSVMTFKMRL